MRACNLFLFLGISCLRMEWHWLGSLLDDLTIFLLLLHGTTEVWDIVKTFSHSPVARQHRQCILLVIGSSTVVGIC